MTTPANQLNIIPLSDPSTLKLVVRAYLQKGYKAVTDANVEVQVGSLPWKPMKDDGLGRFTFLQ